MDTAQGISYPRKGTGVTERSFQMADALNRFLALCMRNILRGEAAPVWPSDWPSTAEFHDNAFARIAFHGVALALMQDPARNVGWPARVRDQMRDEARLQRFWEMGHREVLTGLIAALGQAGTECVIIKGTALAYSAYPDPAVRRRGDSDLLLGEVSHTPVRRVLAANGFRKVGDARPLQETWASDCPMGFTHAFDLHWRINASAVLAQRLERGGIGLRTVPLPQLCNNARAIAPADNLILVAINRASHEMFGYQSGDMKVFDQDRLIWALDFDLLCASFCAQDWQHLLATAGVSGTSPVVLSALEFAEAALGTIVPTDIKAHLSSQPGDDKLLNCLGTLDGFDRLRLDLSATHGLAGKLRLARYTLFPGPEVLHQRFPDATNWPIPALHGRRLVAGMGKMFRRHS